MLSTHLGCTSINAAGTGGLRPYAWRCRRCMVPELKFLAKKPRPRHDARVQLALKNIGSIEKYKFYYYQCYKIVI